MKRLVSMFAMITVAFALSMPVFAAQNSTGDSTTTTTTHHKHHKNKKNKKSHKNSKKNKNEAPAQ